GPGGRLLLASEGEGRVLEVSPDGTARWWTPPLYPLGRAAGLFRTAGAGIEGLAILESGAALIAAEREPRGLIELPAAPDVAGARRARAVRAAQRSPGRLQRSHDVAQPGLCAVAQLAPRRAPGEARRRLGRDRGVELRARREPTRPRLPRQQVRPRRRAGRRR